MTTSFDPDGRETALLESLGELHGAQVLEIGVGDGRLTWKYARRTRSVVGVDTDFESLADLVEDREPSDPVHPICSDSEFLPFPSERFDAAVLAWSL